MTIGQMVLLVRRKGDPDTAWRDIEAAAIWSNGDGEMGAECRDKESIRRFLSAAARSGSELELKTRTPQKEKTSVVLVARYLNRGINRSHAGFRNYAFCAVEWPTYPRFVTVQTITD